MRWLAEKIKDKFRYSETSSCEATVFAVFVIALCIVSCLITVVAAKLIAGAFNMECHWLAGVGIWALIVFFTLIIFEGKGE